MILLFALGLLLIAGAIALVVRAVALPRLRMATHLRQIDTYGVNVAQAGEDPLAFPPPLGQSINALAESVGRFAIRTSGTFPPLESRVLASAGYYRISVEAFHGYRVMATLLVPAVLAFEVLAAGFTVPLTIAIAILTGLSAWVVFGSVVRRRSEARLREVDAELPELIDVLIATIEAGLGFAGSLQLVAARFDGPLGRELRLALQEQRMGISTNRALSNILERSDTPSMRSFVRGVVQAETLGISIGQMMRNLALEMRTRRRQTAQERVQKAPLKMLFPLIFMIFPAMLIVLLYPALHELLAGFSRV
jgi:tight adherence protein C